MISEKYKREMTRDRDMKFIITHHASTVLKNSTLCPCKRITGRIPFSRGKGLP
jgi:hypothetical protein